MTALFDRAVGVYHFLGDRTPPNLPLVAPRKPPVNRWTRNGHALVARLKAGAVLKASVAEVLGLLGGLEKAVSRGERVMVKPNFNSADPPPASSDLTFLRAVVELLLDAGARVTIGESAGGVWRPTAKVFRQLGLPELARQLGVELVAFEDRPSEWVRVKVDGRYLSSLAMPRPAHEADKLVYLPCLKTHNLTGFSGALKLAFGFVHPGERRRFHMGHLQQKIAEVSLCWQPDLVIVDGRKSFVSGGPDRGRVVEPGVLMASGDLIAIDVEAIEVLLGYKKAKNKLTADPWQMPQIAAAVRLGIGSGVKQYILVEGTT